MTGASGTITKEYSTNWGKAILTIAWTQTYTVGATSSTVTINAVLKRGYDDAGGLGGTWYAYKDGGISVNGKQAVGWSKDQSVGFTYAGDIAWQATGSVTVSHTAATNITISVSGTSWYNTTYSSHGFTVSDSSNTVTLAAIPQARTLTISQGTGSSVTVKRNGTALANGATLYDGDTLTITGAANTGYNLDSLKVNGSAFTSGSSHTVSGAVSVATTASIKSFTLSITQGTGTTVTVKRTASPKAGSATGNLSNGAAVYYSDTLQISVVAASGYEVTALTANGSAIASGGTHTVTGAVAVVSAAKQLGLAYIGGDKYLPYICINGVYVQCQPYIGAADGSAWILQS